MGFIKKAKLKLKDIDITVDEDGKHYKLVYGNNLKYMCTMAKTPSEVRGTKNLISEIRKMFF